MKTFVIVLAAIVITDGIAVTGPPAPSTAKKSATVEKVAPIIYPFGTVEGAVGCLGSPGPKAECGLKHVGAIGGNDEDVGFTQPSGLARIKTLCVSGASRFSEFDTHCIRQ